MAQQGYPHSQPLQVPANAYELIISHQLGRPLAFYREKPRALTGGCFLVVGVFLELSLLPLLLFLSLSLSVSHTQISVATLLTPEGVGLALYFLLAVLFGFLIGWGGLRSLTDPLVHLYLCQEGVVSLTGRREIVMRWDQVTSVTRYISRWCCLRRSDGVELTIREGSFEHGEALCRSSERQVVQRQLPQVLASYSAGIPISFGDLTVTQQGLSLDHGRKTLLWLIFSRPIHTILWLSLNHGRKTLLWSEVGKIELSQYSGLSIGKQGSSGTGTPTQACRMPRRSWNSRPL